MVKVYSVLPCISCLMCMSYARLVQGKRYNQETLDIRYKDKTIHDVLTMTVAEALEFFQNIPAINNRLQTLYDVGLSYIKLGQSSVTLSGGEAQRVKLAKRIIG